MSTAISVESAECSSCGLPKIGNHIELCLHCEKVERSPKVRSGSDSVLAPFLAIAIAVGLIIAIVAMFGF